MGIDFSGISLPFTVGDLLSSSMGILVFLGGFILLGLVLAFIKPLICTIRTAFFTHNTHKNYNKEYGDQFGRMTFKDTIKSTYESGRYKKWGRW